MKRLLIGTLILILCSVNIAAQNRSYNENLVKAKNFEIQKKWINALASYYDAMEAEPTEKAKEAFNSYIRLADMIKDGNLGYTRDFDIFDVWVDICDEWEEYWKENSPVYFRLGKIEKSEIDLDTRTGSYKATLSSSFTSKYKELYSVVLEGWKKASWCWTGCSKDSLKLTDNPEDRKYSVSASIVDANDKILFLLSENEMDYCDSDNSKDLYRWIIKNVPRDKMKEVESAKCIVKPSGVFWTVNGQKSSYDIKNVEVVTTNESPASNAVAVVKGLLASKIEMVFVKGGTFQMGNNNLFYSDKPSHNVTVSSFYIGKTEVTQVQWEYVMGNNPSSCIGESKPVDRVSWFDAIVYCNKLSIMQGKTPVYSVNGKTNPADWDYTPCENKFIRGCLMMNASANGYRLPTEAEWEYAAKGGNKSRNYKYSGSNDLNSVAWYGDLGIHSVATKTPNELGLYDMSGNVGEWCWDWYGLYQSASQINPFSTDAQSFANMRVIRGSPRDGSYDDDLYYHVVHRGSSGASKCSYDLGFRIVCPSSEMIDYMVEKEKKDRTEFLKNLSDNFVYVQGGTFSMGSNSYRSTQPVHNVNLSSFYIGKTEVTRVQWVAVMGDHILKPFIGGDKHPIAGISWFDVIVFCNKLSKMDGRTPVYSVNGNTDSELWNYNPCRGESISGTITMNMNANGYRLPTEAEWEYAAWGGNKRKGYKYSGSNNLGNVAWYSENSGEQIHDVATKAPNELGLYDMSGNVLEWCWDWYGSYNGNSQTNPSGVSSGNERVMRGGYYSSSSDTCGVARRMSARPSTFSFDIYSCGFRIVRSSLR